MRRLIEPDLAEDLAATKRCGPDAWASLAPAIRALRRAACQRASRQDPPPAATDDLPTPPDLPGPPASPAAPPAGATSTAAAAEAPANDDALPEGFRLASWPRRLAMLLRDAALRRRLGITADVEALLRQWAGPGELQGMPFVPGAARQADGASPPAGGAAASTLPGDPSWPPQTPPGRGAADRAAPRDKPWPDVAATDMVRGGRSGLWI